MKQVSQLPDKASLLGLGWALTTALLTLVGCEPYRTEGRLGLVTRSAVDSTVLLKSGQSYRELGQITTPMCYNVAATNQSTPDNFAIAVERALNGREADALINVTVTTDRGNYFPVWLLIPIPPMSALPAAIPEDICISVSGTLIKFIESPQCNPCIVARTPARELPRTWLLPEDSSGDAADIAAVTSLHPTLQWEPSPSHWEDTTFDLTVWRGKTGLRELRAESIVYERQGLRESSHRIEMTLEPTTHYLWAVRAHFKLYGQTQVTPWSYEIAASAPDKPRYYHFWTPSSLSLPQ